MIYNYKYYNKKMDDNIFDIGEDLEDDDEFEEEFEEEFNEAQKKIKKKNKKKIEKNTTLPVMTKYEKSRIISQRVEQLDANYKTTIPKLVKEKNLTKSIDIALLEFELNKLPPYIIKRPLNNCYEEWRHEDFKYFP